MTISGAYGRDYKGRAAIVADWNAGKDFVIRDVFHGDGSYVNRQDVRGEAVTVRYAQDRKVAVLKISAEGEAK